jgi:flagellar M-ring protein FliF
MSIDKVRVLSTDGTVLASGEGTFNAAPTKMLELERTVAGELKQNVSKTLAPYIGIDNFELSVAARLNLDKREISETAFDPGSRFERSRRTVKEKTSAQDAGNAQPVGVDQNLPSEQQRSTAADNGSARSSERKEEVKNFEANSKTTSTVSEGYRIEALTIAVVVNRKRLQALLGEGAAQDAMDAKLKEIESLVASATGTDPKRGDRITVAAVEFLPSDLLEPLPEPGIMEFLLGQVDTLLKALAVIAATIILVWFGLRPATRMLLELPPPPVAEAANELPFEPQVATAFAVDSQLAPEPVPDLIGDLTSKINRTPQKRLEQMVDYDEDQVVAILKQWLRGGSQA